MKKEKLGKLACPKCRAGELALTLSQSATEHFCVDVHDGALHLTWTDTDYAGDYTLTCHKCGHTWPLPSWIEPQF